MLSTLRPASLRAIRQSRLHALCGSRLLPELHASPKAPETCDQDTHNAAGFSQALAVRPFPPSKPRTLFTFTTQGASKSESESSSPGAEQQGEKQEKESQAENAAQEEAAEEEAEQAGDPKEVEIAALKERVLRAYADMENMRDRMLRENSQMKLFAIQGFAKGLLDVADNLARAASSAAAAVEEGKEPASADVVKQQLKSLLEGVQATERQLLKVFKMHGLERFNPENETFDPNRHEAMFQVDDQSKESGTVIQVLKDGYLLHGRVLRAAEVGVTRKPE